MLCDVTQKFVTQETHKGSPLTAYIAKYKETKNKKDNSSVKYQQENEMEKITSKISQATVLFKTKKAH